MTESTRDDCLRTYQVESAAMIVLLQILDLALGCFVGDLLGIHSEVSPPLVLGHVAYTLNLCLIFVHPGQMGENSNEAEGKT